MAYVGGEGIEKEGHQPNCMLVYQNAASKKAVRMNQFMRIDVGQTMIIWPSKVQCICD